MKSETAGSGHMELRIESSWIRGFQDGEITPESIPWREKAGSICYPSGWRIPRRMVN
jgi:hypothetical protein